MKKIFLSIFSISCALFASHSYAQNKQDAHKYSHAIKMVQDTMPYKATIDGKRISSVKSEHICSMTVIMSSQREYNFSLLNWPKTSHIDASGYTTYVLKDTDNNPHVLRTDQVKGKKFLTNLHELIKNCDNLHNNTTTSS